MPHRRAVFSCLLLGLLLAANSSATLNHPGKWTLNAQVHKIRGTAVNLILLPGADSTDAVRSQVAWWADDHDVDVHAAPDSNTGGRFHWWPASDASLNAGNFPDTTSNGSFVPAPLGATGFNIFCSSATGLPNGDLVVCGGTTEAENGENRAAIFHPTTGVWTVLPDTMGWGRWYPTATTLPDGRVLVTSGSQYRHAWLFGGAASDIRLHRLPVSHRNAWSPPALPVRDSYAPDESPAARYGHTATWSIGSRQAIFGGVNADGSGALLDDLWLLARDDNQSASEYGYVWHRQSAFPTSASPGRRAFHGGYCQGDTMVVVLGGARGPDWAHAVAMNDVWSGKLISGETKAVWKERFRVPGSAVPPARLGHATFWQKSDSSAYVFGGASSVSGLPTDGAVYRMQLVDSNAVRWSLCTVDTSLSSGPGPLAFMASDVFESNPTVSSGKRRGMIVYGGRNSSGAVSDKLFVLWVIDSTTVRWQELAQTGVRPPALEYSAATATENSAEFWIVGGKNSNGNATDATYSFSTHVKSGEGADTLVARWTLRPPVDHPVWGHTFVVHPVEMFARVPEILNPTAGAGSQFTRLSNAPLLQDWYPHMFVTPGTTSAPNRLFFAGPTTRDVRYLTLNDTASVWSSPVAEDTPNGIRGGSSVMYRPGKVVKCGSRDTDGEGQAKGRTRVIDATAASPQWTASGNLISRVNHNLVVMPDGKVIVVGGTGYIKNGENWSPRTCPEIWDPNANAGAGVWEGAGYLDSSSVIRGYHSSAILLPDGRILCAGGNATTDGSLNGNPHKDDQLKMDIYSPPYLFTAAGAPAQRPVITSLPRRAAYGEIVAAAISDSMIVSRVTLVRPGAVTHGFDENQRFIELAFHCDSRPPTGQSIYHVSLPSDSTVAPPGEYMLFMLNEAGTPSVARWIRLNNINGQSGAPSAITNLGKFCSDGQSMDLFWTPPVAVEGAAIATPVAAYELRYSTTGSLTNANFSSGTLVSPVTTPGDPLGAYTDRLNGFPTTLGLTYRFRMRSKNYSSGNGVWSALSNQLVFTAHDEDCGGAGGGGGGYYDGGFTAQRTGRTVALRRPGGGSADTSFVENTLLPVIRLGSVATDRVRLPNGPKWEGATGRVRLSRAGTLGTEFEGVQLVAVDHATEDEVFVRGGEFVAGTTEPVVSVHHADGRDLTADLASGEGFEGRDGDTLFVDVQHHEPGTFVLSSSKSQLVKFPDVTGIRIATETSNGWVDIGHHNPRKRVSDEAFAAPALDRVRLIFMGEHRLEGVARLVPGGGVRVQHVAPTSVTHSQWGDVTSMVAAGEGLPLQGGESAYAEFPYSEAPVDTVRDWYLEVTGLHFQGGGAAIAARMSGAGEGTPTRFALAPGSPNPFHGSTRLAFELPVRAKVRLEVFDVLGRRVAMPVDASYVAGRHSVEWNGVGADGRPVAAGVFLCRMTAGEFRAERRLVLVK